MKFSESFRQGLERGKFLLSTGDGDESGDGGVAVGGPGAGLAGDLTASEVAAVSQEGLVLVPLTVGPLETTKGKKMIPVRAPKEADPVVFKRVVVGAYRAYLRYGAINTTDVAAISNVDPDVCAGLLNTEQMAFALACRGIDITESGKGLTPEQDYVLMILADTTSRDNLNTRLRKAGINNSVLLSWRQNPLFNQEYNRIAELITSNYENALLELDRKVGEGDQRAIEKKLEISGRFNPATQNTVDALAVINKTVEILAKHLSDQPELLKAVATDLAHEAQAINAANQSRQIVM